MSSHPFHVQTYCFSLTLSCTNNSLSANTVIFCFISEEEERGKLHEEEVNAQDRELEELRQEEVDKKEDELKEEVDTKEGELEELSQEEVDKKVGELEEEFVKGEDELATTVEVSEDVTNAAAEEDARQNKSADEDAGEKKPSLEDEVIHKETMDMLEDSDKQAENNAGISHIH